jgi:hypothetical protein
MPSIVLELAYLMPDEKKVFSPVAGLIHDSIQLSTYYSAG